MDYRSLQTAVLLFLAALPLLLSGCAAIVKGSRTPVQLDIPPQTVIRNYSGYAHELTYDRGSGGRLLKLRSGESYLLEYQYGENRDSIFLWPKVNVLYVVVD